MTDSKSAKSALETAADDLFDFAVDREDVKWLMGNLHKEAKINRTTVEYELGAMKIIMVGWNISFCMENHPAKDALSTLYWNLALEFSKGLSTTTEYMTGQKIDYFDILKERLDTYVKALTENPNAPDPATVVGPEFARICGNADDIFTSMAGSKMFISLSGNVKEYLRKAIFNASEK